MATYILVAGAWLGGWAWRDVARALRGRGHEVFTPTLTGLGERRHLARPEIDLETHILDVLNVLEFEDLADVVLVGHSYAGLVTGSVAHRAAACLQHLVYLDSSVPVDGQSFFDEGPPEFRAFVEEQARVAGDGWRWPMPPFEYMSQFASLDGISEADLERFRAKAVPHPIGTLTQAARLGNAEADAIERTYVRCTAGAGQDTDMPPFVEAARAGRDGWHYRELATGHWPMFSMPNELAKLLAAIADERRQTKK